MAFQYLKELIRKTDNNFLPESVAMGQEAKLLN